MLFSIVGCSTLYKPIRTDEVLTGMNLNLKEDGEELNRSAGIIDAKSDKAEVKKEAAKISVVADRLINEKDPIAVKMKSYIGDLESKVEKLMNDKRKRVDNFYYWGIVFGSFVFAGGIAFIIVCYAAGVPNLAGLALQIALFGASIALFSGLAYYYFWLGITAIAVIVGVFIIMLIVKAIRDNKSLLEVIKTSEIYKNVKDKTQADTLAKAIQSNETRTLVSVIRTKAGLKEKTTKEQKAEAEAAIAGTETSETEEA
jgi:hypothetical protein